MKTREEIIQLLEDSPKFEEPDKLRVWLSEFQKEHGPLHSHNIQYQIGKIRQGGDRLDDGKVTAIWYEFYIQVVRH